MVKPGKVTLQDLYALLGIVREELARYRGGEQKGLAELAIIVKGTQDVLEAHGLTTEIPESDRMRYAGAGSFSARQCDVC